MWPDTVANIGTNYSASSPYNWSSKDLGGTSIKTLKLLTWTDSSTDTAQCNESLRLQYKDSESATWSSTTWGVYNSGSNDFTDVTGRYVRAQMTNEVFNFATGNCTITSVTLNYDDYMSDIVEGLPMTGTNVGSFLTNLAPGVGGFIIILGVFGGVGAIIYSLTSAINRRLNK